MIPNSLHNPAHSPEILVWKDPMKEEADKPLTPGGLHHLPLLDYRKNEELKVLLSRMNKLKAALEQLLLKDIRKDRKEELSEILSEANARIDEAEEILRERREI